MQFSSNISLEMFLNIMKSAASQDIRNQAQGWLSRCSALLWRGMAVSKLAVKLGANTSSILSQCNIKHWDWK